MLPPLFAMPRRHDMMFTPLREADALIRRRLMPDATLRYYALLMRH